jgi:virulence factor
MSTTTAKIRTPSQPVRVGVVGAGRMGSNHLRIYAGLKGVELVGVVDADAECARRAAAQHGCRVFASAQEMAGEIDAATVAVPSSLHGEVAVPLLAQGVHCLVEKPLATSEGECEALIRAADESGVVLLVGHVERFNPVVRQLGEIMRGNVVQAVDVRRMSALGARITDVDVVADLMIHDIDVVLALMGTDVTEVFAQGVVGAGGGAAGHDYVTATLMFAAGSMATLTASRITHNKIRELNVTADIGYITASYLTQELLIHSQARTSGTDGAAANYVLDLAIERVLIRPQEPLDVEIRHFVDAVRGEVPPLVSGRDALNAMRFVWEIQRLLAEQGARAACPT